ncbi:monovalent cation:proton antiporter-2 (CPA2) family protein [Microvirga lotononidis]|uniref:Transporter, monovalent cation:proton antiporter-2 (CPA2) family n=1 Tax=Microvirga lotononidis TaxID=864069 RepID=I4YPY0_9HYPH|nr:monovalent cation:proton antiporter-2 (CPA2) family protein [Microvirga lotononidis]EIM26022.1 transporter, monovalent cation:proton antiporter-2 (CPA2) family [Microvirga lotononidis]WQO25931.1 monovalent cation:proton antiporter-2 (CPA2) family protein [Microvirga lotononidis]
MASTASHVSFLPPVLTFCAAAVVAVPVFRLLGLSAVLGYLAAGVAIGPSGLSLVEDPQTIATVAELGVVLLLFIIGLELKLSHLWEMKRDIFGLGFAQLAVTTLCLGGAAYLVGFTPKASFVTGAAVALSATAIALQMLGERNDLQTPYGQRSFAILLFQDLSVVPLLAVLPLLASGAAAEHGSLMDRLLAVGEALVGIGAVVLIGRYGLNPFFRILARSGAREVMTASALLVVLGAALLMQEVGLSMAMGAFLAGLLLAESNFRHQLEADIEPFRGMLLGLFFMSVGMSIDLALVREQWLLLTIATPVVIVGKSLLIALLSRLFGASWRDGLRSGALLCTAGEFAFVLLPVATGLGLMSTAEAQPVTALAAITMLLGPLLSTLVERMLAKRGESEEQPDESGLLGQEGELESRVLVIGFGRFGQIVNQVLLAQGIEATVIDKDVERIRDAGRFGLQVYYGDGTRLDVLRAAGAEKAEMICICIDDHDAILKIIEIIHENFQNARSFVRAFDRIHAIELMNRDVDYQIREVFESAIVFGRAALEELGTEPEAAAAAANDVRKRDIARLVLQKEVGSMGGAELVVGSKITPEPLTVPTSRARALSPETRDILGEGVL